MIEGGRVASARYVSHLLMLLLSPQSTCSKLSIIVAPPAGKTIQYPDRLFE